MYNIPLIVARITSVVNREIQASGFILWIQLRAMI
ncbi:Uncharacterized protein APZ42_008883 [Daphnia magna]|uniref:Uncharacterized protein n=1 Tax=Daphnia magna TaxID=35525 RepID=A0A164ECM3_9CRUS|nr:Uncharacterized protein APZ42_008883 [Daphnia magna]